MRVLQQKKTPAERPQAEGRQPRRSRAGARRDCGFRSLYPSRPHTPGSSRPGQAVAKLRETSPPTGKGGHRPALVFLDSGATACGRFTMPSGPSLCHAPPSYVRGLLPSRGVRRRDPRVRAEQQWVTRQQGPRDLHPGFLRGSGMLRASALVPEAQVLGTCLPGGSVTV